MSNGSNRRTWRGTRRAVAALAAVVVAGASLLAATPAQAAVTGAKATVLGADVVRLTWTKVSGAGSYQVQYSTKSTFPSASTTTKKVTGAGAAAATPYYAVQGLKVSTTYYLRVRACADAAGDCGTVVQTWSSKVSGKTKYIYNIKPTNLVANNISSSSVELSFTNVSGAPGYRIRAYNTKTKTASYVWSQVEELTLTGLAKNTQYAISAAVQQPDFNDNGYTPLVLMGPASKEIKVTTSNYDIPAPTGVRISDQLHSSVTVSWVAPPQFSDTAMSPMQVELPEESEEVPSAEPSQEPEEPVTPTAPSTDPSTPAEPSTPSETPSTPVESAPEGSAEPTEVKQLAGLRPSALPAGYSYRVQYALNKNMTSAKSKDTTDTSVSLTGLTSNTNYYVRVYVVDAAGKQLSDRSAYQIAKTRIPTGILKGSVTGLSGSQYKDVVVSIYGTGGEMVKQVDLASNGSYTALVRPGSYRVKVSYLGSAGLTSAWARSGVAVGSQTRNEGTVYSFSAAGAQTTVASVQLIKGASLTGTVQNKSGTKLSGVDIAVLTAQTSAREIVQVLDSEDSESGGGFALTGLGEGYHWVRFVMSGYKNLSVRLLVENSGGTLKVTEMMISDVTYPVTGNPNLTMS